MNSIVPNLEQSQLRHCEILSLYTYASSSLRVLSVHRHTRYALWVHHIVQDWDTISRCTTQWDRTMFNKTGSAETK